VGFLTRASEERYRVRAKIQRTNGPPRTMVRQNLPASNWLFVGETSNEAGIVLKGKLTHRRTINSKYGTSTVEWLHKHVDPSAHRLEGKPKFKYLLPLDDEIAERINSLSKRCPNAPQAKRTLRLDSIQERAV
jgi:hypothetical protein